ncbi:MAG: glycosyltransferase family 1 protein [Acidimicrobiales bacterium]
MERPLRVAVDATSLYDVRTGVGRFTAALLQEVAPLDELEVTAFAVTWRGHGELETMVPAGVAAAPRRMAAAPMRSLWRRFGHPRIEHWVGPIDVVHGPNYVVPPARAARVVTVHDLTFLHFPQFCTREVLQYPGLLRRAIDTGAWIHTDSDFVRDEVIELLGADAARVVSVPLGITLPADREATRGRQIAGGDEYVLALGTVEPRKNLPVLVEAFDAVAAQRPELRLVVAGPDGWGVPAFRDAVARATHRDRIVRLGFVSEADRGHLLAGAGVVAVPSHYEGFGLTAVEAMLAGAPVVASAAGSHREVVGNGGLLVPPGDRDALSDALLAVLGDSVLAESLRQRGRVQAQRYSWRAMGAGIEALWRRAASADGG